MRFERRHSTSSGRSTARRQSATPAIGRGSSRSACAVRPTSPSDRPEKTEIPSGCSTDVGYYPEPPIYVEPRATPAEWAAVIVGIALVYVGIYLLIATIFGLWPW